MDFEADLQDHLWYHWLDSGSSTLRFWKPFETSAANKQCTEGKQRPGHSKRANSKVEERIDELAKSLANTQGALEAAGRKEQTARREYADTVEAIRKQQLRNSELELDIRKLNEDLEGAHSKQKRDAEELARLEGRIGELVEQVRRAEEDAEENQGVLEKERTCHAKERDAMAAVVAEHENCLVALQNAQEAVVDAQRDLEHERARVCRRDASIHDLKHNRTKLVSKLTAFTTNLRKTSKELSDNRKRLGQVSKQLGQAERVIGLHFTMLSSLEAYKERLSEELSHLRTSYEEKTSQLVAMREILEERNLTIADLLGKNKEHEKQHELSATIIASTKQEVSEINIRLEESRAAAAAAEQEANDLKQLLSTRADEWRREKTEMCNERENLRQALENAQRESIDLSVRLTAAEADVQCKGQTLADEIAAHQATSNAAEKQKLRLQESIESLRADLQRSNNDLRRSRETLFSLNEKCQDFMRAQMSLANYRQRTRILNDNVRHDIEGERSEHKLTPVLEKPDEEDNQSVSSSQLATHDHPVNVVVDFDDHERASLTTNEAAARERFEDMRLEIGELPRYQDIQNDANASSRNTVVSVVNLGTLTPPMTPVVDMHPQVSTNGLIHQYQPPQRAVLDKVASRPSRLPRSRTSDTLPAIQEIDSRRPFANLQRSSTASPRPTTGSTYSHASSTLVDSEDDTNSKTGASDASDTGTSDTRMFDLIGDLGRAKNHPQTLKRRTRTKNLKSVTHHPDNLRPNAAPRAACSEPSSSPRRPLTRPQTPALVAAAKRAVDKTGARTSGIASKTLKL